MKGGAGEFLRADAEDLALVGFEDLEAESFEVELFAGSGHSAADMAEQARYGGNRFVGVFAEVDAEHLFDVVDGGRASHDQRTASLAYHFEFGMCGFHTAF